VRVALSFLSLFTAPTPWVIQFQFHRQLLTANCLRSAGSSSGRFDTTW
jgi:hypothetical protein